jgi:hypothetical protein
VGWSLQNLKIKSEIYIEHSCNANPKSNTINSPCRPVSFHFPIVVLHVVFDICSKFVILFFYLFEHIFPSFFKLFLLGLHHPLYQLFLSIFYLLLNHVFCFFFILFSTPLKLHFLPTLPPWYLFAFLPHFIPPFYLGFL